MTRHNPMTDEQLLMALHQIENDGIPMHEVGRLYNRSKGSFIGAINRVRNSVEPDPKHDGTMPPLWWKKRKAHT